MLDRFVYKAFTKYFQGTHKFQECKKEVLHYLSSIVRNYYTFYWSYCEKELLTKYRILANQE